LPVAPGVFFPVSITKKGLGDPTLAWRYTFYRTNGLGWVSAWTVNAALGLPLGSYDDVTVPRALQPGTGNFVPTVGGNYYFDSASYGTFVFNLSYANPLERNGYRFPSTFNYNLAFAYPIYPNGKLMPGRVYPFVPYLHLEFLGTRTGQQHATNQFANGSNANTGGNLIRCAPAISFDMLGWSVAAQYMFPISQSLHGVQPIEFDRAFLVLFGFEMAGLG
jgi:hypothetical protein